jgi:hypothetical protein
MDRRMTMHSSSIQEASPAAMTSQSLRRAQINRQVAHLGALPAAPLAMPKQRLETEGAGLWRRLRLRVTLWAAPSGSKS